MSPMYRVKITRDNLSLYKRYKKSLRCFNGGCINSVVCAKEEKASRGANNLVYTITINKPCEDVYMILRLIGIIGECKRYSKNAPKQGGSSSISKFLDDKVKEATEFLKKYVTELEATRRKEEKERMRSLDTPT
jgi:hypothetical protein